MMNRKLLELKLIAKIELAIRKSKISLWEYCKTLSPDFYKDTRPHLKTLCEVLQNLYELRLLDVNNKPYRKLMINMPPRMGKSRTLINFVSWALGLNNNERIITASFNDDLAKDFSRYTRDLISQEKERPEQIVYSDIFPSTHVKKDNASYGKWALDGQFFSYKGVGISAGITGLGASIIISDDLVKDAKTAYNIDALNEIWKWYTGTFLSRKEEGAIEIMCATRWSKFDPCGMILEEGNKTKDDWYILKFEAFDGNNMLCDELLSKESYEDLQSNMDPIIFKANYHQISITLEGRLYSYFKEYSELPKLIEGTYAYIDTADTGKDFTCCIIYKQYKGQAYIIDILYTKDSMEITEPKVAKMLFDNKVKTATFESNNGGRGFARNVERLLYENHKTRSILIKWFHQSQNKISRILSNATNVMNSILFPEGWKQKYKLFYDSVSTYQREGKNSNDDAEDTLTLIAESLNTPKSQVTSKSKLGIR